MTEQQTDKATPRPWDVFQLDEDNWVVCAEGEPPHGIFGEKQDADLTVEAVNAYDPAREAKVKARVKELEAALHEACKMLATLGDQMNETAEDKFEIEEFQARARKELGE